MWVWVAIPKGLSLTASQLDEPSVNWTLQLGVAMGCFSSITASR